MKKRITKIWGVGLVLVLAASLLFSAAPVSAGTLDWGTETIPSKTGNALAPQFDVEDLAVSADGVMYSINASDNFVWKSTNGGVTWSKLSKDFDSARSFVAVALDDSDVVATSNLTEVEISTNGGSTWGSLGRVYTSTSNISVIADLAVSATDGSKNYIGVSGNSTANVADVWWFDAGASAPKWHSTRAQSGFDTTQDTGLAVAFSPNVASDKVMVAVTALIGTNTTYQMYSLNTETWNTPFGSGYPVNVQNDSTNIAYIKTAAIVLSPDYLGSDDSMRIAFLGFNVADATSYGGVYRLKDDSDKAITDDKDIFSLDYDGTNLVAGAAGATDGTKVYYSDNPLATDPDFSTASSLKRPGGTQDVIVAWRGSDVVSGTSGTASAFSVSRDNGKSFNDISLIDIADTSNASLGTMVDVDVAADGSVIYMLCWDSNALSLWRNASSWERVLTIVSASDAKYLVRVAPDDPDAVYVAQKDATAAKTIYYSQEGGDDKWFTRTAKYAIEDMAVESADVVYLAVNDSTTVSKSTNSGFTWDTAKDTEITGGNIYMIRSLGEDKVIVGSTEGYVAWSNDGNSSWDRVNTALEYAGNTQVTASGLADGDYIYASTNTSTSSSPYAQRWEIGQSGTSWKNLSLPTSGNATGIALVDGVLYVQTANATGSYTLRTLSPTTGEPSTSMWSTMYEDTQKFSAAPQALKASSGSVKLWAVDTATAALYSYLDELTDIGPTLIGPADGTLVDINPVSGVAYDVAFSWERPSKATIYDLKIALDSDFLEVLSASTSTSSTTDAEVSKVIEGSNFMPETTYYWRVRVNIDGPVKSQYSETRSFSIGALPEAVAPVVIEQPPAPVIQVPPSPAITITPPEIVLPPEAFEKPPEVVIPPAPAAPAPVTPAYIWAIVIIGAILVIAVIVLIVRTRRPV
jgi:hypothetical protein